MNTRMRAELSMKNEYWIEKHRYYELKHFCLQYPVWRKAYAEIKVLTAVCNDSISVNTGSYSTPTENSALAKMYYSERMEMIEKAAEQTDKVLYKYILKGVTEGVSYDYLKSKLEIPCCKDTYYNLYRRFFWMLDKIRN